MDKYHYNCQYCGKEYIPKRRRVQKYCCTSCKNNSHFLKKGKKLIVASEGEITQEKPLQIEKMSWAGFGNAAAGTIAVNVATNLFTSEENKPATKKDLMNLENKLKQRYFIVKNIAPKPDGSVTYFDIQTNTIVAIKNHKLISNNN
jgi:hypothetical protein